MVEKRRASLVYNPASGRASDDLPALRRALEEHFELTDCFTSEARDADVCAADAVASGAGLVIAAGGDGTVSLVASALVGEPVSLGVVPRGTSNSIAEGLGVPTDLEGAVRNLAEGEARALDTGLVNGRTMVLHASVGLHAAAVTATAREDKRRWGVLAYVREGLASLGALDPFVVELETEEELVRCRAINVMIANVAPAKTVLAQGPSTVCPDDGRFDVTIVAADTLVETVATGVHLLRTALRGEPASRDNVGFLSSGRLRLRTDPPQPILVDGEPSGEGELLVACLPASLRVILPAAPRPRPTDEKKLSGLPDLAVEPHPDARRQPERE